MAYYEHIFIARQDISEQQVETLTADITEILTSNGGKITKAEYWGLRSLAYRVKKNRKGHYSLFNIDASHEAITEMERQMSLNEDILRFMTLRVDALDENPSAPMKNKNRDERRGDRRDFEDKKPHAGNNSSPARAPSASAEETA